MSRHTKENILRLENGQKELCLRRTFNQLFGGSRETRQEREKRSARRQEREKRSAREKAEEARELAKALLEKHANNPQSAFREWIRNDDT